MIAIIATPSPDMPEACRLVPPLKPHNAVRASFDLIMERAGIRPLIAAEVDDMAMLRLLAREGAGLALVPPVVVAGELQRAQLVVRHRFEDIRERFYAILPPRRYPNPLVEEILQAIQTQTRWAKRPA
jgi:LysR family transcriptional regulator, transcriptional activator of nhaA